MHGPATTPDSRGPFVTRFAPSPTGLLHRGHAFSALTAHEAARHVGGQIRLRIEDIDRARCRLQFTEAIFADLAWLGIVWDGPVVVQSLRLDAYAAALERLRQRGLVYRCFKTRAEVAAAIGRAPHAAETPFFGEPLSRAQEAAQLDAGAPFAWRLSIRAAEAALGGFSGLAFTDQVLPKLL